MMQQASLTYNNILWFRTTNPSNPNTNFTLFSNQLMRQSNSKFKCNLHNKLNISPLMIKMLKSISIYTISNHRCNSTNLGPSSISHRTAMFTHLMGPNNTRNKTKFNSNTFHLLAPNR